MKSSHIALGFCLFCSAVTACGDDDVADAGVPDVGVDASADQSTNVIDAAVDADPADLSVDDASDDATVDDASVDDASVDAAEDAMVDAEITMDATVDGMVDASDACHNATFLGPEVALQMVASLPALTGGTIVPGNYVATSFRTTGSLSGALRSTLIIEPNSIQQIQQLTLGAPGPLVPRTFDWSTAGSQLIRTEQCPGTDVLMTSYSATPTSLTIGISSAVHILYELQ